MVDCGNYSFSVVHEIAVVRFADMNAKYHDRARQIKRGPVPSPVGISLMVQDIDQTYEELVAKGVQFTAPPEKQSWGGVFAHMQDQDGNVLTLLGQ